MKTAKAVCHIVNMVCPHCDGHLANSQNGSINFCVDESHPPTATCVDCDAEVKLPKRAAGAQVKVRE